jgi:cation:H+ antiporter
VTGYTRSDWRSIGLAGFTLVPLVLVVFFGVGAGSSVVIAIVAGLAIIAAAFFLSWATEALETVLAQSVALALLALIEVAPEYTFEVILAYRRQTELASASMTGANRLLLGLGWPMIFFVAFWMSRRKGQAFTEIRLDWRNAPEILFLLVVTLYAFVIVLKHTFSLIDSAILILIYGLYIFTALRISGGKVEEEEADVGVAARTNDCLARRNGSPSPVSW